MYNQPPNICDVSSILDCLQSGLREEDLTSEEKLILENFRKVHK
jgi:hypothetical protein